MKNQSWIAALQKWKTFAQMLAFFMLMVFQLLYWILNKQMTFKKWIIFESYNYWNGFPLVLFTPFFPFYVVRKS